jgi:hypothetical protein
MNLVIGLLLVGIVASLGQALFGMAAGGAEGSARMARALTIRIGLSVLMFLVMLATMYFR